LSASSATEKIGATAPIGLALLAADCRYLQIDQRLTEMHKALQAPRNFCLTGKSAICLSSPACKNIVVFIWSKSSAYFRRPVPVEGRWPSSRTLGRDAVDAGGASDEGAFADDEVVWS
jgi:hypothetical protein